MCRIFDCNISISISKSKTYLLYNNEKKITKVCFLCYSKDVNFNTNISCNHILCNSCIYKISHYCTTEKCIFCHPINTSMKFTYFHPLK
jgi:hypothetical protein